MYPEAKGDLRLEMLRDVEHAFSDSSCLSGRMRGGPSSGLPGTISNESYSRSRSCRLATQYSLVEQEKKRDYQDWLDCLSITVGVGSSKSVGSHPGRTTR
jgi:hypothetical protein